MKFESIAPIAAPESGYWILMASGPSTSGTSGSRPSGTSGVAGDGASMDLGPHALAAHKNSPTARLRPTINGCERGAQSVRRMAQKVTGRADRGERTTGPPSRRCAFDRPFPALLYSTLRRPFHTPFARLSRWGPHR